LDLISNWWGKAFRANLCMKGHLKLRLQSLLENKQLTNPINPRSKFEFEQDLPCLYRPARNSVYWPDPMVQFVALTRLIYDRGQFSWHSPVRGLTMTTPIVRFGFLQLSPPWSQSLNYKFKYLIPNDSFINIWKTLQAEIMRNQNIVWKEFPLWVLELDFLIRFISWLSVYLKT